MINIYPNSPNSKTLLSTVDTLTPVIGLGSLAEVISCHSEPGLSSSVESRVLKSSSQPPVTRRTCGRIINGGVTSYCQSHLLSSSGVTCAAMAAPPRVQTGQVPHPAIHVVQGDSCPGLTAASEDNPVTQGNAAGIPVMKIVCGPILCYVIRLLFAEYMLAH